MGRGNPKGGKGHRKRGRKKSGPTGLVLKESGTEYVKVEKMLGNSNVSVVFPDGNHRIARIPGKMHKRVWVKLGDILLVGLRDYQEDHCDVLHVYNMEQVRTLQRQGDISFKMTDSGGGEEEGEIGLEFREDATDMIEVDNDEGEEVEALARVNDSSSSLLPISAVTPVTAPTSAKGRHAADKYAFDIDEI